MKLIIIGLIVICFGLIGFEVKRKYLKQAKCLEEIYNFLDYYKSFEFVFKSSLVEIIENYKLQQKNKNAFIENIFCKSENVYKINENFININIYNVRTKEYLIRYFNVIGKQDFSFENKRLDDVLKLLGEDIELTNKEIKTKGDLYFKIILALGVAVSIIVW